jgi:hypothetical protein
MKTRETVDEIRRREAALLWMHPKTRAKLKAKAKKGNKDRKSVEGMTGAQGEYPLDVLKAIFG